MAESSRRTAEGRFAERADSLAKKKQVVLGGNGKSRFPLKIVIVVSAIAVVVAAGVLVRRSVATGKASPAVTGDQVSYPLSLFDDGKARHFQFEGPKGITVKYFVLKSSDGVIRAAFDACDVCWPAGKGYVQDGDYMVCRNCGRRFASVNVNVLSGGCNPAPLEREVAGDRLALNTADIARGSTYFDLPARKRP